MAGVEGRNPGSAASAAVAAAEAEQPGNAVALAEGNNNSAGSTANQKKTYRLPARFVEEVLSREYKPSPRLGDDDESKYEAWNQAIDLFNQLKEELMVSQAKLRDEYITNGFVEVDDDYCDEEARRTKAIRDLGAFVEKLKREREEEPNGGRAGEV